MKVVLQRVKEASCTIDGETTGRIGTGYMILVGFLRHRHPGNRAADGGKNRQAARVRG